MNLFGEGLMVFTEAFRVYTAICALNIVSLFMEEEKNFVLKNQDQNPNPGSGSRSLLT